MMWFAGYGDWIAGLGWDGVLSPWACPFIVPDLRCAEVIAGFEPEDSVLPVLRGWAFARTCPIAAAGGSPRPATGCGFEIEAVALQGAL
jgi:hypothetical protein